MDEGLLGVDGLSKRNVMKVLLDHGSDKYAEGETWKKLKKTMYIISKRK